jgi:hypothetical protein
MLCKLIGTRKAIDEANSVLDRKERGHFRPFVRIEGENENTLLRLEDEGVTAKVMSRRSKRVKLQPRSGFPNIY